MIEPLAEPVFSIKQPINLLFVIFLLDELGEMLAVDIPPMTGQYESLWWTSS